MYIFLQYLCPGIEFGDPAIVKLLANGRVRQVVALRFFLTVTLLITPLATGYLFLRERAKRLSISTSGSGSERKSNRECHVCICTTHDEIMYHLFLHYADEELASSGALRP